MWYVRIIVEYLVFLFKVFGEFASRTVFHRIVPCLECEQCGEKYYTDEVAERLEAIVNMAKKLMQEIAVIDYPQVA